MSNLPQWHKKLQQRRDELGLSHRDIIAAVLEQTGIRISDGLMTGYMNGALSNPRLTKLKAIANVLGLTLSELFEEEDQGDEDRPNRQRPHTGKCEAARLLSAA